MPRALSAFAFTDDEPDLPRERLAIGGALHRQMLALLEGRRSRGLLFRPTRLDALRRLKLRYVMSQRHFPRRLANYLAYRAERGRVARVRYFPPVVTVESSLACNLRCPGCAVGLDLLSAEVRTTPKAVFESVVDQAHERALQLGLHVQGEPLLNPSFAWAAEYAASKGLWTVAHSNLSLPTDHLAERLVDSRLCNLVVSCDGATQRVYGRYRRGGDVELVLDNVRAIAREKARRRTRLPWITAKFVVFDHNWHEMAAFRERALAAGADEALFVAGNSEGPYRTGKPGTEKVFHLADLTWRPRVNTPPCPDVWSSLSVDPEGAVTPCCYAVGSDGFAPRRGSAPEIAAAWNGEAYLAVRRFFLAQGPERAALPQPCARCAYTLTRRC